MYSRALKSVLPVLAVAVFALLPMGCKKAPPITLSCNASAPTVYPGDPLTVTATAGSVDTNKKNNVLYSWSGDGVTGSGTSASVNTASLAPGSYTAKADVKEGKKGKEGLKPGQTARMLRRLRGEAIRAADSQLLGQPDHHQAGRLGDGYGSGREPAESSADL